ncbi:MULTISPECIES: hypothetical protein [unclassified Microcoleus]|uniref:hypothetical protein n=1 Tax=unclassified Microcoleus TaxID=2642155 RepID=UPI002FD5BDFE
MSNFSQVWGDRVKLWYCLSADLISGDMRSTKYLGLSSTSKYLTLVQVLPGFDCQFTTVLFARESLQLV